MLRAIRGYGACPPLLARFFRERRHPRLSPSCCSNGTRSVWHPERFDGPPGWTAVYLRDCNQHDFVTEPSVRIQQSTHMGFIQSTVASYRPVAIAGRGLKSHLNCYGRPSPRLVEIAPGASVNPRFRKWHLMRKSVEKMAAYASIQRRLMVASAHVGHCFYGIHSGSL